MEQNVSFLRDISGAELVKARDKALKSEQANFLRTWP